MVIKFTDAVVMVGMVGDILATKEFIELFGVNT